MEPLIRQLDAAKLEITSKTQALWAAEEALQAGANDKMRALEEADGFKIQTNKGSAQNEALRRSLLEV